MTALAKLDWSLVQAFLAVAETGSLSAAARELDLTQPTIGRHIQTLEQDLGVSLFNRQARGMALTAQGEALLVHARGMREAAEALSLDAAGKVDDLSGSVRITTAVHLAHYIMPTIIAEIREAHPQIQIELVPSDTTENLLFREADIAVRMYRPTQLDMVTVCLGKVALGLYGSKSYIQRRGRPTNLEEVMAHDIVGYDRNNTIIEGFAEEGIKLTREFFPVRCDNQTVAWELIRAGTGLGFGPACAGCLDESLVEIDLGVPLPKFEVWLTAHEAVRRSPRVDAVWQVLAKRLREICELE